MYVTISINQAAFLGIYIQVQDVSNYEDTT